MRGSGPGWGGGLLVWALACSGAPAVDEGPSWDPSAAPGFRLGEDLSCRDPVEGFQRLSEEGAARGLDHVPLQPEDLGRPGISPGAGVVAEDLDGDGDVDLAFPRLDGAVEAYDNDGSGRFTRLTLPPAPVVGEAATLGIALAAADLSGDGLPELIGAGPGRVEVRWNLGELRFSAPILVHVDAPAEHAVHTTMALGDLDGDGDLDVVLPSMEPAGGAPREGSPDLVLRNDGPDRPFTRVAALAGERPGLSFVGLVTDRDGDGDGDVLIASEGGRYGLPPTAFYRNDGLGDDGAPVLVDDAAELHADLPMSGMGVDAVDLDADGTLDYCLTDTGPVVCLLGDGRGGFVQAGPELGLAPEAAERAVLWSIELVDLDADGFLDAVAAGGAPGAGDVGDLDVSFEDQRDAIWRGGPDLRFEDRTEDLGFGDPEEHYGLAAADLDGDGRLDVVAASGEGPPVLWMNRCSPGRVALVELEGPPANPDGWGALVKARVGERWHTRELQPLRAFGQGPSAVHLGLGAAERIDQLVVRWPDGVLQTAWDLPAGRVVRVRHPDHRPDAELGHPWREDSRGFQPVDGAAEAVDRDLSPAGVAISLLGEEAPRAFTDAEGRYRLLAPPGPLDLLARRDDLVPSLAALAEAEPGREAPGALHPLLSEAALDAQYRALGLDRSSGAATVLVLVQGADGRPLVGAEVALGAEHDGVFALTEEGVRPGGTVVEGSDAVLFVGVVGEEASLVVQAPDGEACVAREVLPLLAGGLVTARVPCG